MHCRQYIFHDKKGGRFPKQSADLKWGMVLAKQKNDKHTN